MTVDTRTRGIDFDLPAARTAPGPPERRGIERDGVRLMVADRSSGDIRHSVFRHLDQHLTPGDVLVVNASGTVPAAVDASTADGRPLLVHFAAPTAEGFWAVELRTPGPGGGTVPGPQLDPQTLTLAGGGVAHLLAASPRNPRLWITAIEGIDDLVGHLRRHGRPIRYSGGAWPIDDHQTVFATEPGSAEMPSAGRPFTPELVTRLVATGILVVPIVLHTGLSSYEDHEHPGDERFRVPDVTARVVNTQRAAGARVVAVGTTVVRALETVAGRDGIVRAASGTTDLLVTPDRGVLAVDALLTGWHEPRSSHLLLLEAVAGRPLLEDCYRQALATGYEWHEFGDELLILAGGGPGRRSRAAATGAEAA